MPKFLVLIISALRLKLLFTLNFLEVFYRMGLHGIKMDLSLRSL